MLAADFSGSVVGVNLFLVYKKLDFTLGVTRSVVKIQLNAKRCSLKVPVGGVLL